MDPPLRANGVYGDYMFMMEVSGRLRFVLEAEELLGVEHGRKGKHLECDAPVQGNLFRLVDNAHAAPADFTQEPEIAQLPRDRGLNQLAQRGGHVVQLAQTGKIFLQLRGKFRMARDKLLWIGSLACLLGIDITDQDLLEL